MLTIRKVLATRHAGVERYEYAVLDEGNLVKRFRTREAAEELVIAMGGDAAREAGDGDAYQAAMLSGLAKAAGLPAVTVKFI